MTLLELQLAFEKWWTDHYDGLDGLDDQDKALIAVQYFTNGGATAVEPTE